MSPDRAIRIAFAGGGVLVRKEPHQEVRVYRVGTKDRTNARVDVVFLHGLAGDAVGTWTYAASEFDSAFWLEWLAEDDELNVRVLSVDYPTAITVLERASAYELAETARSVQQALLNAGVGIRPLVFVCHSLGGLVLKEFFSYEWTHPQSGRPLLARAKAVYFFGTPHDGSFVANLTILARIQATKHVKLLMCGLGGITPLALLRETFATVVRHYSIAVFNFYEQEPTHGVHVVSFASATSGFASDPEQYAGIGANHFNICKFPTQHAQGFGTFRRHFSLLVSALPQVPASPDVPPIPPMALGDWTPDQWKGPDWRAVVVSAMILVTALVGLVGLTRPLASGPSNGAETHRAGKPADARYDFGLPDAQHAANPAASVAPTTEFFLHVGALAEIQRGGDWYVVDHHLGNPVRNGDLIQIAVEPTQDTYLFIFHHSVGDGTFQTLYPRNNGPALVAAGTLVVIPEADRLFRLHGRPGPERFYVVATREPNPVIATAARAYAAPLATTDGDIKLLLRGVSYGDTVSTQVIPFGPKPDVEAQMDVIAAEADVYHVLEFSHVAE